MPTHYCTDPDVTWEMAGDAPNCALLGGFAIGARVALLRQYSANAKCQRVFVLALCLVGNRSVLLASNLRKFVHTGGFCGSG